MAEDSGNCSVLRPISRRRALQLGITAGVAVMVGTAGGGRAAATHATFAHGVASGDPLPHGVVLWTRVTPTPESVAGSGAGPTVAVTWEVSADPDFDDVTGFGTVETGAERDHTVSVDVDGLSPATTYWYRFTCLGSTSAVGQTRTAPAPGQAVDRLRMAVVSCSNLQAGWFSAYRHLAARTDLDLVVHLGDYLYEYAPGEYQARDVVVRPHDPPWEMVTLADYRRRHAQYKSDPDLQVLHAAAPWVVTWDDHDTANDAWAAGAENHTPGTEGEWAGRRAGARQAFAEWMPVRWNGDRIYRRLTFGALANLSMLDLRSYRDEQVGSPLAPGLTDPERALAGPEQLDFLLEGLSDPDVRWKLVGNPVMLAPLRFPSAIDPAAAAVVAGLLGKDPATLSGPPFNVDQWDGYPAEQAAVLALLRDDGIRDAVFLTGDIHSGWAAELPNDPATYPVTGDSLGVELICTSVTSDNLDDELRLPPRTGSLAVERAFVEANPHVKYLDFDSHGYSVLEVTPDALQMDWYVLRERTDPNTAAQWSASWRVTAGSGRVQPAPAPFV